MLWDGQAIDMVFPVQNYTKGMFGKTSGFSSG